MTMIALAFDGLLALTLIVLAWRTLASPDLHQAVVLLVAFGLQLSLAWVRLDAPDIALAEAAIGAGITGVLLMGALGQLADSADSAPSTPGPGAAIVPLQDESQRQHGTGPRVLLLLLTLMFAAALGTAVWQVMVSSDGLLPAVQAQMPASGVAHPVTAVLLNFRAYDTLLEMAVLMLALLGVLALSRTANPSWPEPSPVLTALARGLLPLVTLVAAYLLWRGSHAPGGAFQAGAVLAGALVLANLAGAPALPAYGALLRSAVALGLAVFVGVALVAMSLEGALLEYPSAIAGGLILLIEASLTLSIALVLTLLVTGVRAGETS